MVHTLHPMPVTISDREYNRLKAIEELARHMVQRADSAGLLLGIGRSPGAIEGSMVRELRRHLGLIEPIPPALMRYGFTTIAADSRQFPGAEA